MSSDFLGGRKRAMLIGLSGLSVALIGIVILYLLCCYVMPALPSAALCHFPVLF